MLFEYTSMKETQLLVESFSLRWYISFLIHWSSALFFQNNLNICMYFNSEQGCITTFWCSFHTSHFWFTGVHNEHIRRSFSSSKPKPKHTQRKTQVIFSLYKHSDISAPKLGDFMPLKKEAPKLLIAKAKELSRLCLLSIELSRKTEGITTPKGNIL